MVSTLTPATNPLPHPDLCARIGLACAGVSGHPAISTALEHYGDAITLLGHVLDDRDTHLPVTVRARIRRGATPIAVADVLRVTARTGMRILTPDTTEWPAGLAPLGRSAPLLLWAHGNVGLLGEEPVAITGSTHPTTDTRNHTLRLGIELADAGYTIAATTRPGIDRDALRAADAVGGRWVAVAFRACRTEDLHLEGPSSDGLVVSENPPGVPVVLASALRTHALLAGLAAKVVVVGGELGSGATRTGLAAHAFGHLVAVTSHDGEGSRVLADKFRVPVVATAVEVVRLR